MALFGLAALLAATSVQAVPPVPGGCTAPAGENRGKPGCFLSAERPLTPSTPRLYWHIVGSGSEAAAAAMAEPYAWTTVVEAHDRWWLYVLSESRTLPALPRHDVVGPLIVQAGKPTIARFMESWFTPGMRTRVHTHSGPEAFYVIYGQQCTETPGERRRTNSGQSYVVAGGPHLQAAPQGRRSLVLILAPSGEPWMRLSNKWSGTDFCR
jgi:quercetin dioxygenase-like cupin family protein